MSKLADMKDMSVEELQGKARDLSTELFNLRFQLATNQLEKPHRIRQAKRDLARVRTLLTEKQAKGA